MTIYRSAIVLLCITVYASTLSLLPDSWWPILGVHLVILWVASLAAAGWWVRHGKLPWFALAFAVGAVISGALLEGHGASAGIVHAFGLPVLADAGRFNLPCAGIVSLISLVALSTGALAARGRRLDLRVVPLVCCAVLAFFLCRWHRDFEATWRKGQAAVSFQRVEVRDLEAGRADARKAKACHSGHERPSLRVA